MKKETQEGFFIMKWKNFVVMMTSIVVGTNTTTGLIFNQEQNTLQIEYNIKRANRMRDNERERNAFILKIDNLEEKVRERNKELKDLKS